jgi:nucleoside-diphosphate-sugar epimerase
MRVLVTGSAGHLGEALIRALPGAGHEAFGADINVSPFTDHVGSIADRRFANRCIAGMDAIVHAATLHKPHVATHTRQAFIDTNVTGTLNLLEEAARVRVRAFVFTSTTSAFGRALVPAPGEPAAWITEQVAAVPKNIYGVTKIAAEDLCELFHHKFALPCVILRTSRFFPEADDRRHTRETYADLNVKMNEFLYRRVDLEDVAVAHLLALERAPSLGFGRYIISATTPFTRDDLVELRVNAPDVVARRVPRYRQVYQSRGWSMFPRIDRVYVNDSARRDLGWQPKYDFTSMLGLIEGGGDAAQSPLARLVGSKGYHRETFADGPYPVE